jgi:hypothetical protein
MNYRCVTRCMVGHKTTPRIAALWRFCSPNRERFKKQDLAGT